MKFNNYKNILIFIIFKNYLILKFEFYIFDKLKFIIFNLKTYFI